MTHTSPVLEASFFFGPLPRQFQLGGGEGRGIGQFDSTEGRWVSRLWHLNLGRWELPETRNQLLLSFLCFFLEPIAVSCSR